MIKQGKKKHTLSFSFIAVAFFMLISSLNIIAQPIADGGISQTICSGASVTIGGSPSASGGTAPYTYSWNPVTGLNSATVANPTASPSTTTTYTLTVTDAVSGVSTATLTVAVNPSPVVTVNSTTICAGDATTLVASGATAYTWLPGGMTTPSIVVSPSVNTTYTLTGTNGACTASTTATVTVNPLPVINAGTDQSVCTNTPVSFNVTGTGVTYYWIFDDGNYSTLAAPTHSYSTGGFYYASVRVTSASGCYSDDTLMITVSDPPVLSKTSTNVSCNGLCNGTATVSATGAYPPFTFSWNNGVTTSSNTNLCAGYYLATITNSAGCASSDTVQINEPAAINPNITSVNISCNGGNNGSATVSPTGGVAPFTYYWSPGSIVTPTAMALSAGMYTVSITDANGCIKSANAVITEPSQLVMTTSGTDTICLTTSATISGAASGGTPPYLYSWSPGGATTAVTVVSPSTSTSYTVIATDANSCSVMGQPNVVVLSNTNITGQVTYSGGALSSGVNKAVLFKQQSVLVSFDTVQITTLDASGLYNFSNVNQGDYLVKVFPDTSVYHNMVPTYYGNHYLWDSAATVFHGCSVVNTANIVMIEGGSGSGPGEISGHITQGIGFGRAPGGPVPGIDIKLGRNPGGLYANTQTDSNGDYSFTGIPVNAAGQKYVVYVDIPGIGRDSSYTFTLSANQSQFNSLDYYVDSAMVHPVYNTTVGINHEVVENNKFSVYPNPSKGKATIEYTLGSDSRVTLVVYNVLGVKISELVNENQSAGKYTVTLDERNTTLSSGIYFIELNSNEKKFTHKMIVTQ